jgi:DeoR family glycerol-3-phosphate regulon repressor
MERGHTWRPVVDVLGAFGVKAGLRLLMVLVFNARSAGACQRKIGNNVVLLTDCLSFGKEVGILIAHTHRTTTGRRPMLTRRHGAILKLLENKGSRSVTTLAQELDVSAETVRRDIRALVDAGAVLRVHGAVGLAGQMGEAPFHRRMRENAAQKRGIARALAAQIADGESLMLDTGTTTSFVARELLAHRRLTIVTNSSDIARTLATVNGNRVFMAGGELRSDSGASLGASALEFIRAFAVQHAIISAGAVDASGVMDFDLQEAEFARAVLACGERRVVVTDASKFGRRGFIRVTGFETLDAIITDTAPPSAVAAAVELAGVAMQLAAAGDNGQ